MNDTTERAPRRPDEQATTPADRDAPAGPEALEEARRSEEYREALSDNASPGSAGSDGGPDGAPGERSIDESLGLVDRPEMPRD